MPCMQESVYLCSFLTECAMHTSPSLACQALEVLRNLSQMFMKPLQLWVAGLLLLVCLE